MKKLKLLLCIIFLTCNFITWGQSQEPLALCQVNLGPDTSVCLNDTITLIANGGAFVLYYQWSTSATTPTITVSPTITTTYSVTITTESSCTASDEVVVTVNSLPTAEAGSEQTICKNPSCNAFLMASGAGVDGTYLWNTGESNSAIMVKPSTSAIYTVTATDNKGCSDDDFVFVTVINNDADLGPDTTICSGNSIILTAGDVGCSYSWNTGATTYQITETPTATTTYSVTVQLMGHTDSDNIVVTVDTCTSIPDNKDTYFSIYPNPSGGIINVFTDKDADLEIFNTEGKIIFRERLTGNNQRQIDISSYPKGMYFLKFTDRDNIKIEKVLIE